MQNVSRCFCHIIAGARLIAAVAVCALSISHQANAQNLARHANSSATFYCGPLDEAYEARILKDKQGEFYVISDWRAELDCDLLYTRHQGKRIRASKMVYDDDFIFSLYSHGLFVRRIVAEKCSVSLRSWMNRYAIDLEPETTKGSQSADATHTNLIFSILATEPSPELVPMERLSATKYSASNDSLEQFGIYGVRYEYFLRPAVDTPLLALAFCSSEHAPDTPSLYGILAKDNDFVDLARVIPLSELATALKQPSNPFSRLFSTLHSQEERSRSDSRNIVAACSLRNGLEFLKEVSPHTPQRKFNEAIEEFGDPRQRSLDGHSLAISVVFLRLADDLFLCAADDYVQFIGDNTYLRFDRDDLVPSGFRIVNHLDWKGGKTFRGLCFLKVDLSPAPDEVKQRVLASSIDLADSATSEVLASEGNAELFMLGQVNPVYDDEFQLFKRDIQQKLELDSVAQGAFSVQGVPNPGGVLLALIKRPERSHPTAIGYGSNPTVFLDLSEIADFLQSY